MSSIKMKDQSPETIVEAFSHQELAEMYLEMVQIVDTLETHGKQLYAHAKSLEIENKMLVSQLEQQ